MHPQLEAKAIFNKYRTIMFPIIDNKNVYHGESLFSDDMAKKCSLIDVNGTLSLMIDTFKWDEKTNGNIHYWQEVKAEIEKL